MREFTWSERTRRLGLAAALLIAGGGLALAEDAPAETARPAASLAAELRAAELRAAEPRAAEPQILPPDLPEARVVITVGEQVAAALAARLADPRFIADPRLPRHEREGIAAFYALGAFAPLFVGEGGLTPAGRGLAGRLAAAADDGLDPRAYPLPALPEGLAPAALAEAELRIAASAILYARDARGGRLDPARLPKLAAPKLDLPAADAVLERLAAAGPAAGLALGGYNPAHPGYRLLKARLAELRARRPMAETPEGAPGSAPVRHTALGAPASRGEAARPTAPAAGETELLLNMERWRWLPPELGARYVAVNIPEFRGRVMEGGASVHDWRVIVGKTTSPTPVFSGRMTYAVVNPSWTIPPSILKNEFLPRLARDPNYAARLGYQVVRRGNSIAIRQPPGERNALGFIKFMFPNDYAVYLHDTPNRGLFSAASRAFSHGCVRVDDPFGLAEILLGPAWPSERLKGLIGRGERSITLAKPLPVHLTYFTLVPDGGRLRSVADIYGYDAKLKVALSLK